MKDKAPKRTATLSAGQTSRREMPAGRCIIDVVEEMMPTGSHTVSYDQKRTGNEHFDRLLAYAACPEWPADVFAVAATLIELTGCYTHASLLGNHHGSHSNYIEEVFVLADEWHTTGQCPQSVQSWWIDLIGHFGSTTLSEFRDMPSAPFPEVVLLLMKLLTVADEASIGVGWMPHQSNGKTPVAERAALSLVSGVGAAAIHKRLPYVPMSLCERIPPDKATVLPKALTPSVGCTLRSMSHHLALLPPSTVLASEWFLTDSGSSSKTMRLLIVPFPYRVDDESFVHAGEERDLPHGARMAPYFTLSPTWLKVGAKRQRVTAKLLRDKLLVPLIEQAHAKFGQGCIDGVLFPECALTEILADDLQALLTSAPIPGLKFLITGTTASGERGSAECDGTPGRNLARTVVFPTAEVSVPERNVYSNAHSKHHRWALDKDQILRYGLTGLKAPAGKLWEHIDVNNRRLPFLALRNDLCMTVLICEDLARADPAMSVVRSVGPNLVVALLMDGPQLASRWPGRYATVLAEDPGCSVLSITSAGMVDRSNLGERNPARAVGLWRHDGGGNTELYLPQGHHGLVLTVEAKDEEQYTFDHRSDQKTTKRWRLERVTPLAIHSDWS